MIVKIREKVDPKIKWSLKTPLGGRKGVTRSALWAPGTEHVIATNKMYIQDLRGGEGDYQPVGWKMRHHALSFS